VNACVVAAGDFVVLRFCLLTTSAVILLLNPFLPQSTDRRVALLSLAMGLFVTARIIRQFL
jgi:hypothetical protein